MDKLIFQSSFLLFVTSNNYNAWMTCSGISPLGHLYSKNTSIHEQGTQNLVPEKCSHNLCIGYLSLLQGHIFSAERDNISRVPKPRFNLSLGVEHHSELKLT